MASSKRRNFKTIFTIVIVGLLAITITVGFISNWINTNNRLSIIKEPGDIQKVEVKVVSDAGIKSSLITDSSKLDMINTALKQAQEIKGRTARVSEIWSDLLIYKNNKKVNLRIQHSIYNGWVIIIGNKTFNSNYMFRLVEAYK